MRKVEINIDINSAMSTCLRAGVKVEPVKNNGRFSIEIDNNGTIIKGEKLFGSKEIANAVSKTYKYYAKLILKQKEDARKSKEN